MKTPTKGIGMKPDKIVAYALIAASFTAIAFSKKITDHLMLNGHMASAKYGTVEAWKADAARVNAKVNDSSISGKERNEYRKMQFAFYDIAQHYYKK
jgi:hypothetical protein